MLHTYATAISVPDGDTVVVRLNNGEEYRIRVPGLNTTEMHVYSKVDSELRGEPGAVEACLMLRRRILNKRVKLEYLTEGGSLSGTRERQHVLYRNWLGIWKNPAVEIAEAGYAIPFPSKEEWSYNKAISAAAQRAAAAGKGLWSTKLVTTNRPIGNFKVVCTYNPSGSDVGNEYVTITNLDGVERSLAGWWVRDAAAWGEYQHGYTFPAGAKISARGTVVLDTGTGINTATKFYWGRGDESVFNNPNPETEGGDACILGDRVGNFRAWHIWPDYL